MSLVVVAAGQLIPYVGPETAFHLRVLVKKTFVDSDGQTNLSYFEHPDEVHRVVNCTVAGGVISHAGFTIQATTNALDDPKRTSYIFELYTTSGEYYQQVHRNIVVPHDVTPTTLGGLAAYSHALAEFTESTYSRYQIAAMFANLVNMANKANEVAYGAVRLNTPATSTADPIAVGPNDPLLVGLGTGDPETIVYRSTQTDFDTAVTAALNRQLCFNTLEVLTATKSIDRFRKVSLSGDGKWDVAAGHGLTVANLLDVGDRKLNIGEGKLVLNGGLPFMRMAWWTGPFGGTTTLNGAIVSTSATTFTLTNAETYGPAPFTIAIDKEIIRVTAVSGNNVTACTRGYDSTAAATHLNGATVYAAITSKMVEGMLESAAAVNAGKLLVPPGIWAIRGGIWNAVSGMITVGSGGVPDAVGGSIFRLITDNSHIVKIGEGKRHIYFEDIGFDCSGVTGGTGVRVSGLNVAAQAFLNAGFIRCRWYRGDIGFHAYDETGSSWLALNLYFEQCEFNYQDIACYKSGTVNGSWLFNQCNFSPAATAGVSGEAVCGWHNYCGPVKHINCTYNGQTPISPQTYHTNVSAIDTASNKITTTANHRLTVNELAKVTLRGFQRIKNTVVAAAGITSNGNARSVVTINGVNTTVTVAVTTGVHTTATLIAAAFVTALNADPTVSASCTASNTGADIFLRRNTIVDNDATFNFTIEDVTSAGITEDLFSTDDSAALLPAATVNINRLTDIISLHRQEFYFKPISATEGYGYLNPHTAFLVNESDYRINLTDSGTGTIQLRTNAPIREGKPKAVLLIENTITPCVIENSQDESFPFFAIIRNQYEVQKALIIKESIIQSPIRLEASCIVTTENNWMLANAFHDVHTNVGAVAATVSSYRDQIVYDGAIGGYKDQGNTVYNSERVTLNGFCSFSRLEREHRPDKGLIESAVPRRVKIDKASAQNPYPAFEIARDRNVGQYTHLRIGIKEAWEEFSSQYQDILFLDPGIDGGIAHSWMANWTEWRSRFDLIGTTQDGRFLSGDVAFRGSLINVKSKEITPTTGTATIKSTDGDVFYFSSLTGNVDINISSVAGEVVRGYETKKLFIPVSSTNRFVGFGNNFNVPAPRGFNTGTKGNYWVLTFETFGGNNWFLSNRVLCGTDANLRDVHPLSYRYPAGTPETALTQVGYISILGTLQTFTLPADADMQVGEIFSVSGYGGGGWRIAQNASQVIIANAGGVAGVNQTTTGTSGRIDSTDPYDSIWIQKIDTNTFKILDVKGNVTLT